MNLIFDTHTMLWSMFEEWKLSATAAGLINDPANSLWVSVSCLWEIVIKIRIGKLKIPGLDIQLVFDNLDSYRIRILPIRPEHLRLLQTLPMIHRDPFDRILIVQSISEGFPLITADRDIRKYDLEALW